MSVDLRQAFTSLRYPARIGMHTKLLSDHLLLILHSHGVEIAIVPSSYRGYD